jgi:[acyl-carrier-protein] S-malonyltransferase
LTRSDYAQPAVLTASYALYRLFRERFGPAVQGAAGHSLGEISALAAAGAVSFAQAVDYVRKRGRLMQQAQQEKRGETGLALDLERTVLEDLIRQIRPHGYAAISGYNSPRQFVVAGVPSALRMLDRLADDHGGEWIPFRMVPMKANAPYHSELMEEYLAEWREAISQLAFKDPEFPVWSTVTGEAIRRAEDIPGILERQLTSPVLWTQALQGMAESGASLFIDIGPQQISRNLVREHAGLPECLAFDDEGDRLQIFGLLGKERLA